MHQVLQSLKDGTTRVRDVPAPHAPAGQVLIRTTTSLVSSGTERMLVGFGKAGWLSKVRQQPEKVKAVLDKVGTDGLVATLDAVQSKLDEPLAPGYCNVGVVVDVGVGVKGIVVGDRVASNGKHAELVCVPKNLCARIPEAVTDEHAAFTVLAAVGLQGVRLAAPQLGESAVVIGLGLIGLLTVQILRAQGCRVLGVDMDPDRLALAEQFGARVANPAKGEDVLAAAQAHSRGQGVDVVIITASTRSNEPIAQAASMCRKRGRIVLVGVTGLELSRSDFYEKELSFQVSCSYGPGRYDATYEEGGHDYPVGFVRWTVQRNFEAVLDLLAAGSLDVAPLISHRFALQQAPEAYDLLTSDQPSLGIVLQYPGEADRLSSQLVACRTVRLSAAKPPGKASVAFLGAGNHAGRILMPAFKEAGALLHTVVSAGGVSAVHHGSRSGFYQSSTDADAILADPQVDTVVVATRHDAHAGQVTAALQAGKHVFCEKPLCLRLDDLRRIGEEVGRRPFQKFMLGFNRRYAPQVIQVKRLLAAVAEPKNFVLTVNAGAITADHWVQDLEVGGGRIVGEGCHFIDLLRHLAGAPIVRHSAVSLGRHPALSIRNDKVTITLEFADGSVGTIHYLANGHKAFPKERLEVFCAGRILQLNNFRKLQGWGWKDFKRMNLWSQDKGHAGCVKAFVAAIRADDASPIPWHEIEEVTRVSIELEMSLR